MELRGGGRKVGNTGNRRKKDSGSDSDEWVTADVKVAQPLISLPERPAGSQLRPYKIPSIQIKKLQVGSVVECEVEGDPALPEQGSIWVPGKVLQVTVGNKFIAHIIYIDGISKGEWLEEYTRQQENDEWRWPRGATRDREKLQEFENGEYAWAREFGKASDLWWPCQVCEVPDYRYKVDLSKQIVLKESERCVFYMGDRRYGKVPKDAIMKWDINYDAFASQVVRDKKGSGAKARFHLALQDAKMISNGINLCVPTPVAAKPTCPTAIRVASGPGESVSIVESPASLDPVEGESASIEIEKDVDDEASEFIRMDAEESVKFLSLVLLDDSMADYVLFISSLINHDGRGKRKVMGGGRTALRPWEPAEHSLIQITSEETDHLLSMLHADTHLSEYKDAFDEMLAQCNYDHIILVEKMSRIAAEVASGTLSSL